MTTAPPRRVLGVGLAASLLVLGVLRAQEPKPDGPDTRPGAPTAGRGNDPSRRVPDFFGQIGLTPEQRETIYKIRAKHQARINELEKQILEIQTQSLGECEGVLTETQKQLLAQRRKASGSGASPDNVPKKKSRRSN